MVFIAALMTFWIESLDVTVVSCDVDWIDQSALEQMLSAEFSELSEDDRQGIIATVDQCEDDSVRLRTAKPKGRRERKISIAEIPKEARMRTVALALGELAREPDPPPAKTEAPPTNILPKAPSANPKDDVSPKKPRDIPTTNAEEPKDAVDPLPSKSIGAEYRYSVGVFARSFFSALTFVPEARVGMHFSKWRISLGGYGWGWTSKLGAAYLTAFTLMGGPSLWEYDGKISADLDLLMEFGAAVAFGNAHKDTEYRPRFNIAAGGHLAFRLGPGLKRRFHPSFTVEAGWLRGLNLYADGEFLGGFEGPSVSGGILALW